MENKNVESKNMLAPAYARSVAHTRALLEAPFWKRPFVLMFGLGVEIGSTISLMPGVSAKKALRTMQSTEYALRFVNKRSEPVESWRTPPPEGTQATMQIVKITRCGVDSAVLEVFCDNAGTAIVGSPEWDVLLASAKDRVTMINEAIVNGLRVTRDEVRTVDNHVRVAACKVSERLIKDAVETAVHTGVRAGLRVTPRDKVQPAPALS
jgi:hypothetical protein